jgi:membrane-associated phospholipid phosphatase
MVNPAAIKPGVSSVVGASEAAPVRDTPAKAAKRGGSILLGFVRETWRLHREGCRELPAGTWRRWLLRMVVAWLVAAAFTAALVKTAQRWDREWMGEWDRHAIVAISKGPISFQNAILLESPGNLIYMIPATLATAIIAARMRRPVFAATVLASWVLVRPIIFLGWHLWDRTRPNLIAGGVAAPPLHSFPSGHIVLSLSLYGLLAWALWRASRNWAERLFGVALCAAWCASLAIARVVLGSHWPTDIMGGALVGLVWLAGMIWVVSVEQHPRDALAGEREG